MFDFSWGEIMLIGVVALIVIGPKELPGVLRTIGQWVGKVRRMAAEFQGQFQEAMREAEMADLKKHVDEFNDTTRGLNRQFDPLHDFSNASSGSAAPPTPSTSPSGPPESAAAQTPAADSSATSIGASVPETASPAHENEFSSPASPTSAEPEDRRA